jgi:hypothetical protein
MKEAPAETGALPFPDAISHSQHQASKEEMRRRYWHLGMEVRLFQLELPSCSGVTSV